MKMVAMDQSDRGLIGCVETRAGDERRRGNVRQGRRLQRIRGHGGGPAEHATVIRVLAAILAAAGALACRSTQSSRNRARGKARSPVNLVMMMQDRNGKLHAESHQRQPDKSEATSRYFHLGLQLSSFATSLPFICHNRGGGRMLWT